MASLACKAAARQCRRFSISSTCNIKDTLGATVDVDAFHRDGVGVVKQFASREECEEMMERMKTLIDSWDPKTVEAFRTDEKQTEAQGRSDYFLDSADRIHFFLEPDAIDKNGFGHGLHLADPIFRRYSFSPKIATLTRALGWIDPVLPQSMYIFKQPQIGGEVTSHQDSTFLYTTPRQTCLGLWLALQDATLTNGCIWARPGSHKEPIRRHFKRNPEYFGDSAKIVDNICKGDPNASQMAARDAGFEAYPVRQGDLILIHGAVDHMSLDNSSNYSRHTFQLHLIEGPSVDIEWSPHNWLQFPQGKPFPLLNGIENYTL
eukprot:GSMAST32.ASY1.ANO1.2051.1 assembled CDS